jgi:hypothetical protein
MVISVAKSAGGPTLTPPVDAAIEAPGRAGRRCAAEQGGRRPCGRAL